MHEPRRRANAVDLHDCLLELVGQFLKDRTAQGVSTPQSVMRESVLNLLDWSAARLLPQPEVVRPEEPTVIEAAASRVTADQHEAQVPLHEVRLSVGDHVWWLRKERHGTRRLQLPVEAEIVDRSATRIKIRVLTNPQWDTWVSESRLRRRPPKEDEHPT